jgi:predicted HTH domain antitoxin
MEVKIRIPDDRAHRLSADGDSSRRVLEAFVLEGYRDNILTLLEVSELLGLARVETEDFLCRHKIPLPELTEADLDRDAEALTPFKNRPHRWPSHDCGF